MLLAITGSPVERTSSSTLCETRKARCDGYSGEDAGVIVSSALVPKWQATTSGVLGKGLPLPGTRSTAATALGIQASLRHTSGYSADEFVSWDNRRLISWNCSGHGLAETAALPLREKISVSKSSTIIFVVCAEASASTWWSWMSEAPPTNSEAGPITTGSPGSTAQASTRLPFTKVPLLLPRSSKIHRPNGSWKTRACSRETSLLSITTSHRGLRPMIVPSRFSSTCRVWPRSSIVNSDSAIVSILTAQTFQFIATRRENRLLGAISDILAYYRLTIHEKALPSQ